MLITSLALFAVAALLGIYVALQVFSKKPTTKAAALAHGAFGAAGLVVLILFALRNPNELLTTSIIAFVVAALGGLWVFINDLKGKPGPIALLIIHAVVAVAAFGLVAIVALR